MNKLKVFIYFAIIFFGFFGVASFASAAVSLPYLTTYNCADWTQGTTLSCDGLSVFGGWTTVNGSKEQIIFVANNSSGGGGKGQRHWIGYGNQNNSGGTNITFTMPQSEFWMRWYMRFQLGFEWDPALGPVGISGMKLFYIDPGQPQAMAINMVYPDSLEIGAVSSPVWFTPGWNAIMANGAIDARGNKKSDGQWHEYELHLKMDTNGSNGVGELWVDGVLIGSSSNRNYNTQAGWSGMTIGSNASGVANLSDMAVDFDDIAISTTGYIGPITGGVTDITPPSAPSGLVVN